VDAVLAAILAGSALAALKGLYLFLTPVTVDWDGVWQARRIVEPGVVRIILRGADVLLVVSTVVVATRWWFGRRMSWPIAAAGALSAFGVLLSGTRSNWAGLAGGLAWLGAVWVTCSKATIRRAVMAGILCAVILIITFTASEGARRLGDAAVAVATGRLHTVDFRRIESIAVLDAAWQTYGLGAGFGATYEYWDIGKGSVVRTPWSHNGYLEILLKTGVLGLLVSLSLVWHSFRLTLASIRRGHPWADRVLGVQGGLVAILVLSLTTNKFFELSGPMFLGFAFAVVQAAADAERG
jgi:O-antigen ligase